MYVFSADKGYLLGQQGWPRLTGYRRPVPIAVEEGIYPAATRGPGSGQPFVFGCVLWGSAFRAALRHNGRWPPFACLLDGTG